MVRQHHAAGTDTDRRRPGSDVSDDDGGRGARNPRHVVVLGDPIALEAPPLGVLREVARIAQRVGCIFACRDRREIEDRERNHTCATTDAFTRSEVAA